MTLTKLIELQGDSYRDYINSGKAPDFLDFVMDFDFAALDEKIKRYEDALRFYSDNWQSNSTGDHTVPGGFMSWQEPNDDLIADEGERARKALEGME